MVVSASYQNSPLGLKNVPLALPGALHTPDKLFGVARAPDKIDRSAIQITPGLYKNDVLADCTSVAMANGLRGIAKLVSNDPRVDIGITDANVVRFYSQSTGYDPSVAGSDSGANINQVIHTAVTDGYPTLEELYYPLVCGFDYTNLNSVRLGIYHFGVTNVGLALAIADQCDGIWDTTTYGDQTPASWGYHEANLWGYTGTEDDDLVQIMTFGIIKNATWRWVRSRMIHNFGCAYHQIITPTLRTINQVLWDDFVVQNHLYRTAYLDKK